MSKLEFTIRALFLLARLYLTTILPLKIEGLYLKAENKFLKLVEWWLVLQIEFKLKYNADFRIILLVVTILIWLYIQSVALISIYN